MPAPLAYFLTFTCYGQRLRGDARGSIDDDHNIPGTPTIPPNAALHAEEFSRLKSPPVTLSPQQRELADATIASYCESRRWLLITRNVRTTHAHVLVAAANIDPGRAMADIKAAITNALRQAGLFSPTHDPWTRHGSTRWINHTPGLRGAIAYINDWQDGPNRQVLEAHRTALRQRIAEFREWQRQQARLALGLENERPAVKPNNARQ